jgi:hypothetical protein
MIASTNLMEIPEYAVHTAVSYAESDTAKRVSEKLELVGRHLRETQSFGGVISATLEDLGALKKKAAIDNWDGADGSRMAPRSYATAKLLIESMPHYWPRPEVDLDSDGEVSLEWFFRTGRLSISVGKRDLLSYAWIRSNERAHGVAEFKRTMPRSIAGAVSSFLS